ncbi:OmpA family protein [Flavobacterium amniphilum]|uniref:OmpA family protein n=1 Tax=Flavobacterium amniphilum TaxID=1834035 RepID=UPI00202A92DA|nr:OmpA family protein [Flavobacterium amniphilum]MCL9805801.1 OmpA family protein [Flavobacterium amniphilum]MCL9806388.1 OmpA family protein [Flavobacterium amniphilum]
MKKRYITMGLLLLLTVSYGQDKSTERADKFFESYQYINAIGEYSKLAGGKGANSYVYTRLADSYYNVFNTEEAVKWYAKAVEGKVDPETHYRYAQSLKTLGKYHEANQQMDAFAAQMSNDSRAIEHKSNPNYIPSLGSKSKLFDVATTNIQTKTESDFGAVLANDNTLYFVSTRNSGNKKDKWANQPYVDIFQSVRGEDGNLSEPKAVNELNTAFHDGPVAISADGNTMFFARDGHSGGQFGKDKKSNVKVGQQGLYKAVKVDGKWTNIEALPFNSTAYSVTHPALSKDGMTLYFASNMPGGLGESDIWKVSVVGNQYGSPQNLGDQINTPGKESFPFVTGDNVLYFASSGRQGFGGLDVFKSDLNSSDKAQNVGKPVNTEKDDFSFSFNTTLNTGYFSSNRNGTDAIYTAIPVCKAEAIALVTNKKTGLVLANVTVAILDDKGNTITTKQTDNSGKVSYDVECSAAYEFRVSAENFDAASYPVAKTKEGENLTEAKLSPVEVIITDTEVLLAPIYFEFNKSNITAQGAGELDKLVKVMNDHPSMVILVKSHTDTKGRAAYNLNLSEQRAQSTVQYIISKGISSSRISGKGFGSSTPKINCGSNCTDDDHAQNRRSEFMIVNK